MFFGRGEIESKYLDSEVIKDIKKIYSEESYNNVDEININISKIIVHIEALKGIPKFVVTRAIYEDNNNGVSMIRLTYRPSKSYNLTIKDTKNVATFVNMITFYNDFIDFLVTSIEKYIRYAKMEINISKLNKYIEEISNKEGISNEFVFTLGELIEDVDINFIKIGLKESIVINLKELFDFSDDVFKESIVFALKESKNPYDIFKIRCSFTEKLDIYTNKSEIKLFKSHIKKDIKNLRTGIGYLESDNKFAIVERKAVTKEEVEMYKQRRDVVIVDDNLGITKREKEKNKDKIVSFYRVLPFVKVEYN